MKHIIAMNCRINELPENHQVTIIRLINHLASHSYIYQVHAMNRIKKISNENDNKVKLVLAGIASIILFQAFIHIGVNIRLLPTTGMTLPFLSYGGSSIISTSILSGIILNLTKRKII